MEKAKDLSRESGFSHLQTRRHTTVGLYHVSTTEMKDGCYLGSAPKPQVGHLAGRQISTVPGGGIKGSPTPAAPGQTSS